MATTALLLRREGVLGHIRRFQEILERTTHHITFVVCIQVLSSWMGFGTCRATWECVLVEWQVSAQMSPLLGRAGWVPTLLSLTMAFIPLQSAHEFIDSSPVPGAFGLLGHTIVEK